MNNGIDLRDYNRPMQIKKSIKDKDNIPGYKTIILEDGRELQIQDRNGKLSLLESPLHRASEKIEEKAK